VGTGVLASVGSGGDVSSGGGHSAIGHGFTGETGGSRSVGVGVGVGVSASSHFSGVSSGGTGLLVEVGQVGEGVALTVGLGVGLTLGAKLLDWVGRGAGAVDLTMGGGGCTPWFDGGREVAEPSAGGVVSV
jgi:hypothetical protein